MQPVDQCRDLPSEVDRPPGTIDKVHIIKVTWGSSSGRYDRLSEITRFVQDFAFDLPEMAFIILYKEIVDADPVALFKHIIHIHEFKPQLSGKVPSYLRLPGSHISDQIQTHEVKVRIFYLVENSYFCAPFDPEISMNQKLILAFLILAAGTLFTTCNSTAGDKEKEIPADVVTNPNSAEGKGDKSHLPSIQFVETEHDFGKILSGETVSFSFNFRNAGKSDLVIADVSSSCGCTVPSFPKTPIQPGEEGAIKVAFNSSGKHGFQSKNILVVANTQPNTTMLRIKAQVVAPGAEK